MDLLAFLVPLPALYLTLCLTYWVLPWLLWGSFTTMPCRVFYFPPLLCYIPGIPPLAFSCCPSCPCHQPPYTPHILTYIVVAVPFPTYPPVPHLPVLFLPPPPCAFLAHGFLDSGPHATCLWTFPTYHPLALPCLMDPTHNCCLP